MAKGLEVPAVAGAEVAVSVASVPVAAMEPRFPAVVVLGSERHGVSMLGMRNSLNVATATANVLHELAGRVAR
jgi:tRNA G18 (ribose-2'-O)-methylase SpoU